VAVQPGVGLVLGPQRDGREAPGQGGDGLADDLAAEPGPLLVRLDPDQPEVGEAGLDQVVDAGLAGGLVVVEAAEGGRADPQRGGQHPGPDRLGRPDVDVGVGYPGGHGRAASGGDDPAPPPGVAQAPAEQPGQVAAAAVRVGLDELEQRVVLEGAGQGGRARVGRHRVSG
jgi:hypothetical protein